MINVVVSCSAAKQNDMSMAVPTKITIPKSVLADKIKGGWAGQTIGCTYWRTC